ncbi:MAG: hypothetical protein JWN99_1686 [Ilumatobacteraceae bacterium]|nr:hypothetical protein [Ilumatobacteraceae bacterium]
MNANEPGWPRAVGLMAPAVRSFSLVALALGASSCASSGTQAVDQSATEAQEVAAVSGWTRIATTEHYIVVANVLPGERMFTAAELTAEHPTEGELIVDGRGNPLGPDVRHVEAHIYDKVSGLPITTVRPTIVLLNRTSGQSTDISSTLMQDVNVGAPDIHFGNNTPVPGNSDLTLTITVGNEAVTLDGHLD